MSSLLARFVLLLTVLNYTALAAFVHEDNITQSLLDEGLPLYYNWCDNNTLNGCSPHKIQPYGWCVAYAWTEAFETQLYRAGGRGECTPPVWVKRHGYECPDAPRCKLKGTTCVPSTSSGGGRVPRMSMTPYFSCKQQLMNNSKTEVGSISDFTAEFGSWDESSWPSDGLVDMCFDPGQHATMDITKTEAWAKAQKLKQWYTKDDGWDFDNDLCLVKNFSFSRDTYSNNIKTKPMPLQTGDVEYYGSYEGCRRNYYDTKPVGKWCNCSYGVENAKQMTKGNVLTVKNLVPKNTSDIAKLVQLWGPWWNHVVAPFAVTKGLDSPYRKCSKDNANHMIAIVGWDARGTYPSWIVRDSLGKYQPFAYIEMNGNCEGSDTQGFGHLNHGGFLGYHFDGLSNPDDDDSLSLKAASNDSKLYLDPTLVAELLEVF